MRRAEGDVTDGRPAGEQGIVRHATPLFAVRPVEHALSLRAASVCAAPLEFACPKIPYIV